MIKLSPFLSEELELANPWVYYEVTKGILKGFDQATNIILDESHERVYSTKEGVQQLVLGLYIIRGDNISIVGELDEELDASLDLSLLRAHPLKPVIH
ncbi:sm LSM8 [Olea europaea subsp. europaea]|uniref:U6 snRNA-associated Sm-like protein LSm8 n=1 Tax=Olea europaea subsp. europaea TaxID=158383 RepID=A0A8S0SSY1_OLEEU|nr:sm LSM8 [Olea europaea subsp. europaea]